MTKEKYINYLSKSVRNLKNVVWTTQHAALLIGVVWLLSRYHVMQFPEEEKLMRWDAGWYASIVKNGYQYQPDGQCNLAFFPLFPFVWKWSGLSNSGISLLNFLFFLIGMTIVATLFSFRRRDVLFFAATPSLMFCLVPYSEALFFLSVSLLLAGLDQRNRWLSSAGIILCGLTRSVSILFFASIIFLALVETIRYRDEWKKHVQTCLMHLTACVVSVGLVAYIQWQHTGRWFYFLKVQQYWDKMWGWPRLPLTTWGGPSLIWLDGTALFIGCMAMMLCVVILWKATRNDSDNFFHPAFIFSCTYLADVTLTTLLYSSGKEQTSIYSLNRYVFATSFFVTFLAGLKEHKKQLGVILMWGGYALVILLSLILGVLPTIIHHSWVEAAGIAGFIVLSFYYLVSLNEKLFYRYFLIFYMIHFVLQVRLFDLFLSGRWVG